MATWMLALGAWSQAWAPVKYFRMVKREYILYSGTSAKGHSE